MWKEESIENDYERTNQLAAVSFMNKVYGMMTIGLLITAGLAQYCAFKVSPTTLRDIMMPALIAELILVFVLSAAVQKMPAPLAVLCFFGYAALNGVTLSSIFFCYQLGSVGKVFLITAGTFGGMAVYGTVTKRDLTGVGSFCCMALWGLILTGLVNIFLKSSGVEFAMSLVGVVLFTLLTAYDAQKIRQLHDANVETTGIAVLGALALYLDFINLFLYLLRFFGKRK